MKRRKIEHVSFSLVATVIAVGLNVNNAVATPSIAGQFGNFDCGLCHSNPSSPKKNNVFTDVLSAYQQGGVTALKALDTSCFSTTGCSVTSTPPVANAGPDQSVTAGDMVTLNGSGSSDADGDPLTYNWSFTSIPTGSNAALSDATAVKPTFTADMPGDYVLELIVNDGTADSTADSVTITAGPGNTVPVADAGLDQSVIQGDTVTLDGSGSSDANGDPLTYTWSFTSLPAGSSAALSDLTAVMPTFTTDVAGTYELELVVNDGTADSTPDSATITANAMTPVNTAPHAEAGMDQSVNTGDAVSLDGSVSSDADGDTLTFHWTFASKPAGSLAFLSSANTASPAFIPDLPGAYVVQLIVNDGAVDSAADTVTVTANEAGTPPVNTAPEADAGMDQNVTTGDTVTLDGSASMDADGDPLTYIWTLTTIPMGSMATLSDPTSPNPSFVADMAGAYVAQLIVNDGAEDSMPDTVMIMAADQPMNTAEVSLKLHVAPHKLKLKEDQLGEKTFKIAVKVKQESIFEDDDDDEDEHDSRMYDDDEEEMLQLIPLRCDITITRPNGSKKVIQKHHALKKTSKVKISYAPKMTGKYMISAVVFDEAGNELDSESKSVMVILKDDAKRHEREKDHERKKDHKRKHDRKHDRKHHRDHDRD